MEDDKNLDNFIRKSVKDIGLEKPTEGFTELILSKIQPSTQVSPAFVYEPLLSKKAWFLMLLIVAAIFVYVIYGQFEQETTWLWMAKLNDLASFNLFGKIPNIPISNTFVYGMLAVTFFVCIQILILKNRVDKAYNFN